MRIFALELDNSIKGIDNRKTYIEGLISKLPSPEFVVLPELAICSYMASQEMWMYADDCGKDTSDWAIKMANKYGCYIGVGYLDFENGDYYNRYMIADKNSVLGVVSKSEGEAAVFKRGDFPNVIETPVGKVGIGICYDSRRKHFYDNVKDEELSLILFPHGCPADPKKPDEEVSVNDYFCGAYRDAFDVPVVYVNCVGELEFMPGMMGKMMAQNGFKMNGKSKIYASHGKEVLTDVDSAYGWDAVLCPKARKVDIPFFGEDIIRANTLFRTLVLKPDIRYGIKLYENNKSKDLEGKTMDNVNKTLYIPLFGKAFVSNKNIILEDKMAEKIWDAEGFELKGKSKSKWLAYYMGIRSAVFDRWLKEKIDTHKNATVLHIGCGMDSRIIRVGNHGAPWFDIDFPEVISERRKYYDEDEKYKMICGDARDAKWISFIPDSDEAIVVMEGVSMYLKNEEITQLLTALSEKFNKVSVLMDAYSVFAAKMSKFKNPINDVGVNIVYGIDEPEAIVEGIPLNFVGEKDMTPADMIDQLQGMDKKIFQKLYAGRIANKLYKLYEYRKD